MQECAHTPSGLSSRHPRSARASVPTCQAGEPQTSAALSKTYWDGKQRMIEMELAAKLAELEEYEAREAALVESLAQNSLLPAVGAAPAGDEPLERRVAELEAALEAKGVEAEMAIQRTGAFWIEQVAELRQRPMRLRSSAVVARPSRPPSGVPPPTQPQLRWRQATSR